jgi:hypothetical protein
MFCSKIVVYVLGHSASFRPQNFFFSFLGANFSLTGSGAGFFSLFWGQFELPGSVSGSLTQQNPDPIRFQIQNTAPNTTKIQNPLSRFTALNSNRSRTDRWTRLTGKELDDGEEGEDDPVGEPLLVVLLVQRLQRLDRAECRVRESAEERQYFTFLLHMLKMKKTINVNSVPYP